MATHPISNHLLTPATTLEESKERAEETPFAPKMERTMYKLIELMTTLQLHLLDLSKEFSIQKVAATKEMMQAYKEAARGLYMQAACTGAGLIGGGVLGTFGTIRFLQAGDMGGYFTNFGQIGSDIAKKYPEGKVRQADGKQRKFEQLSQELGQSFQSTATAIDAISEKLQTAMRNAAPAA